MSSPAPAAPHHPTTGDTIMVSRVRLAQLEHDRRLNAGRRRIIARALQRDGFTGAEIGRLLGVSRSQAYADLKVSG